LRELTGFIRRGLRTDSDGNCEIGFAGRTSEFRHFFDSAAVAFQRGSRAKPSISDLHRALQCWLSRSAEPDGQALTLYRQRVGGCFGELIVAAVVRELAARPNLSQYFDLLANAAGSLTERDAECLKFFYKPAEAHTQHRAAVRENVQRGN